MAAAAQKYSYLKKINAQKNSGNSAKVQNLTARYRAKVATRNIASGDTSATATSPQGQFGSQYNVGKLDPKAIAKGLKKYSGYSARSRKRTLKASRSLANASAPGTPGGSY